jgi:tRNA 2-thiouridine synthesizing protein E
MQLEVDGDGFLLDRDVWTTEVMSALARADDVELTSEMEEMILLARKMYEADGVVPPLRTFSKATGGDRKGTHLNEMFNGAPMKKIAKWGGLPKPTGCV